VDFKENHTPLCFYEKSAEIRKFEGIHKKAFCRMKNAGTKPGKSSSLSRLEFMPRNLD
jgi:hypothetical protein